MNDKISGQNMTRYLRSLKISLLQKLTDYKGETVTVQWRNLGSITLTP